MHYGGWRRAGLALLAMAGLLAGAWGQASSDPNLAPAGTAVAAVPANTASAKPSHAAPELAAPDLAAAYYHYMLARLYENRAELAGGGEMTAKALEQYRLAIHADARSPYLPVQMAGLLFRAGRTGDAIRLARSVSERFPDSVPAHELLGEIYARLLSGNANPPAASASSGNGQGSAPSMAQLAIQQFQALTRLRPKNADFHLTLGRLYSAAGQTAEAEREFERVRHLAQNAPAAVAELVTLYASHGQMAKAQEVFASVPADQRTGQMYAALGSAYHAQQQYGKAVQAFQQAVDLDGGDLAYRHGLASSLYRDGQLAEARKQYAWLTQADPEEGAYWLKLAEIDRRSGRTDLAQKDLAQAQQAAPDDPALAFFRSQLEESEGHFGRAAAALRTVLQQTAASNGEYAPEVARERGLFWEKLGTLERQAGQPEKAVDAFAHMQRLGREDRIRGYLQIAQTYSHEHQYSQALMTARNGVAAFPKEQSLAVSYALLLAGNRQEKAALAQLGPFLNTAEDRRTAYLALAEVAARGKNWGAAKRALDQAAALATSDSQRAMVAFMRGDMASQRHQFRRAERELQTALRLDPNSALALNDLGYLWAEHGQHLQQALQDIQRAVAAEPENGAYLDSLGWVYLQLHQAPEAVRQLQRAARLEAHDPTILGHLATAYQRSGDWKKAAAAWRQALANWQTSAPADYDAHAVSRDRKALARLEKEKARRH